MTITQKIEAGTVKKNGSNYILPVEILSYDEDGKFKNTNETNYPF